MDTTTRTGSLIDDRGRIFGRVNIIDAIVVILVLAVGVAGAFIVTATVGSKTTPETGSLNVTIDAGTHPSYIVSQINEGDTYAPNGRSNITIKDIYLSPEGGSSRVILRAELHGRLSESRLMYNNAPPRLGRELGIYTNTYELNGTLRNIGGDSSFNTSETTVQLLATLSASDAQSLDSGDPVSVADRRVATIDDVTIYDGGNPDQRIAYVTATLQTVGDGPEKSFGTTTLGQGTTITLPTDDVVLEGRIQRVGTGLQRDTTQVVVDGTVSSETAAAINTGDTYRVAGSDVATVTSVMAYGTDDPERKRVYVGLNLTTLQLGERPQFGQVTIREGATVPFQTSEYVFSGTIQEVDNRLRVGTTQVLIQDTVDVTTATAIDEGDTYRVAGRTIATVESATAYGTNNPDRKRVYVGLNLTTLQHGELPMFGTTAIREGVTVPFETPEYSLGGTVQRVAATEQRGQATNRTVTLQLQDVSPNLAQTIRVGATETTAGTTVTRITSVNRTSSSVILTSQDGNIYEREHPVNLDIAFEANLSVRETTTGTTFKGNTIQRGSEIVLDLGDVTIRATVVSL